MAKTQEQKEKDRTMRNVIRKEGEKLVIQISTGQKKDIDFVQSYVLYIGFSSVTEFFEQMVKEHGLYTQLIIAIKRYYSDPEYN